MNRIPPKQPAIAFAPTGDLEMLQRAQAAAFPTVPFWWADPYEPDEPDNLYWTREEWESYHEPPAEKELNFED
jgi:hypothetical protein